MTNKSDERVVLVLVAAGSSSRMGGKKKEYLPMNGGTVLSSAARIFLQVLPFSVVAVAYPAVQTRGKREENERACRAALFSDQAVATFHASAQTEFLFVEGGATRQQSVLNALEAVAKQCDTENPLVFIHDGARPFVSAQIIRDCHAAAAHYGAAAPAMQPIDTQKETDEQGCIARHLTRARLAAVQTPQAFRFQPLLLAHRAAAQQHIDCTDDTEIWDRFAADGKTYRPTKIVAGSHENKKITYPSDILAAASENVPRIRTGLGYDKHVLVAGRKLMLGGVAIPSDKGEAGHSDGDVLLHAITDALLGAAALGDIGSYFPPDDAQWKDADSKQLLATVWNDITAAGWSLGNIDCVIALEQPKFLPHRTAVCASIAAVLGVPTEQVFVKAKTGEKTGDVGTGKVVEATATCLLFRR
ncbi:MAG: 2-C-methyl-D-erythritol 2,4-cyclodiphosphate synthase [Treponema sp.]|nr:2-C-methyl-D-erythritol 2,4-cyclodiphosphate synthase [Treponema sp.]